MITLIILNIQTIFDVSAHCVTTFLQFFYTFLLKKYAFSVAFTNLYIEFFLNFSPNSSTRCVATAFD